MSDNKNSTDQVSTELGIVSTLRVLKTIVEIQSSIDSLLHHLHFNKQGDTPVTAEIEKFKRQFLFFKEGIQPAVLTQSDVPVLRSVASMTRNTSD